MNKHLKYLKYVCRHKWYVFIECCKLRIPWRGLVHDLSKFMPSEWFPYVKYFYGDWYTEEEWHGDIRNQVPYEYTQMYINEIFDIAWLKHQHHNPHHWQYWILREDEGNTKILDMPIKYRKEMLADWRGAGRSIKGCDETREWYLANRGKMVLHPDTRKWIEEQLAIED